MYITLSKICHVCFADKPGSCKGNLNIVSVDKDRCTVSWEAPEDNGGSPITNYVLEKCETSKMVRQILVLLEEVLFEEKLFLLCSFNCTFTYHLDLVYCNRCRHRLRLSRTSSSRRKRISFQNKSRK